MVKLETRRQRESSKVPLGASVAFGHFYGGGSKRLVGSGDGRISHGIKNILTFYCVTCISR